MKSSCQFLFGEEEDSTEVKERGDKVASYLIEIVKMIGAHLKMTGYKSFTAGFGEKWKTQKEGQDV